MRCIVLGSFLVSAACSIEPHPAWMGTETSSSTGTDGSSGGTTTATTTSTSSTSSTGSSGPSTTGGSDGSGSSGGGTGSTSGAGTGPGPQSRSYAASLVECIATLTLDPVACAANSGENRVELDTSDTGDGPTQAYLIFVLDDAFATGTVTGVTLQMTTGDTPTDASDSTGEVWEVEPFTYADLSMAPPTAVGAAPISPAQGAVTENTTVAFPLPLDLVTPGGTVHLAALPLSDDGVAYWNNDGTVPPELVIDWDP